MVGIGAIVMNDTFYYVYCQGLLGVRTNVRDFKWVYGSVAHSVEASEYEKCIVKFDVTVKKEKNLNNQIDCNRKFQAFKWSKEDKNISYRRTFPFRLEVGYDIKLEGNTVYAEVGERYYKFVKNRVMNLHGMYYLLSDIANVMLLNNGFLTLYASAVHSEETGKCVVNFAPPNTGKTLTAMKLCETSDTTLVGEDVLITDGKQVYSCPWTSSYRNSKKNADSAGSLSRCSIPTDVKFARECPLTDMVVLSLGEEKIVENKEFILKQISILNGYLFNYYSSPIVKVLAYFDEEYNKPWNQYAEALLERTVDNKNCYLIQTQSSEKFANIIEKKIFGSK